jgi:hypothetical protein
MWARPTGIVATFKIIERGFIASSSGEFRTVGQRSRHPSRAPPGSASGGRAVVVSNYSWASISMAPILASWTSLAATADGGAFAEQA